MQSKGRTHRVSRRVSCGLVWLFAATSLHAQTAALTGRITDASGAVVPGASVAAKAKQSGVEQIAESNGDGYYNFPSLLPGDYSVSVSKAGFKPLRQANLELIVRQ